MKLVLTEFRKILDSTVKSDDESITKYYNVANKELDSAVENRNPFYDLFMQVRGDYSKVLDKSDFSPEMIRLILNREFEFAKIFNKKTVRLENKKKK